VAKVHEASGNTNYIFKTHSAALASDKCPECDSHLHVSLLLSNRLQSQVKTSFVEL